MPAQGCLAGLAVSGGYGLSPDCLPPPHLTKCIVTLRTCSVQIPNCLRAGILSPSWFLQYLAHCRVFFFFG